MNFRERLLVGDHEIIKRYVGDKLVWRKLQKIESPSDIDQDSLFNGAYINFNREGLANTKIVKIQVINSSGNKVIIDGSEAELMPSIMGFTLPCPFITLKKSLSHYGLIPEKKVHVTVWFYKEKLNVK